MHLICILCIILIGVERVPSDSNENTSLPYNEQVDSFSDSESEEEVDSALETINEYDPSDQTTKSKNTN